MSNTWFISDLHFGHRKVAEIRGFEDIESLGLVPGQDAIQEHDQWVIDMWLQTVKPDDVVWVLGDLCMQEPSAALEILAQLPGEKHLIFGNHDAGHPMHHAAHKWQGVYRDVFASAQPYGTVRCEKHKVLLSHFPYATDDGQADRGEVRYIQWRLPDQGSYLIHGHTHMEDQYVHGRQIHVGIDRGRFTSIGEIATIIKEQNEDQ